MEKAILAGGCFWCMVQPFEEMKGIVNVVSGYTGGHLKDPTYEQVKSQSTGHTEAVYIEYDETLVTFEELLELYWQQTDPTDAMGQFMDRGESYRPVIFYYNESQQQSALSSKHELEKSGRYPNQIVTQIEPAKEFYPAEEEHQQFYKKNPRLYAQEKKQRKEWAENPEQAVNE
ncbi:MAG: peptide-methionine (S)-S-oxide reductase MsrA [Alkalibacterium sp.]|nr:peptide-methionine (S)-S-oxide reductase MsrA [Alkalibacterium sp.]